jgi:DNA-binding NarL/FixJ family response regulator
MLNTATPEAIIAAVRATAVGERVLSPELRILTLLGHGHSNQHIGGKLSLGANTVSNHVKSILTKLQLDNRVQAAVHAVRAGIA